MIQKRKYLSFFQKLYQCEIKLQKNKIRRTQKHNKSKLKNTYRIKEITAGA